MKKMRPNPCRGFTLVEMIMVIVITGIIGSMVAVFLRAPVQGYVDSARRAEMSDIADTALRRLGRDVRSAVPNSVRIPNPAGSSYIEFLPTRDGGRYRVDPTNGGGGCALVANNTLGDALNFGAPLDLAAVDTCFEIVGSTMNFNTGDAIVIGSTQSAGNLPYLPENSGGIRRTIAPAGVGTGKQAVQIVSAVPYPASAELPGHRFEVVPGDQQAVTYACIAPAGGACSVNADRDGTCQLARYSAYGFNSPQILPSSANPPILADKVEACNFVYDTSNMSNGLVAVTLKLTRGGESVTLYHEIHVNNIP